MSEERIYDPFCEHDWVLDEHTLHVQWVCSKCNAVDYDDD